MRISSGAASRASMRVRPSAPAYGRNARSASFDDVRPSPARSAWTSSLARSRIRNGSSPWRRKSIRVGPDDEACAIELDLYRPIFVGAVRRHACERGERLRCRMTIPVPRADRDERSLWVRALAHRGREAGLGAVVRRHVHARAQTVGMFEHPLERVVDGVAREEDGEIALPDTHNERWGVDEEIVRRSEPLDRRGAKGDPLSGADGVPLDTA